MDEVARWKRTREIFDAVVDLTPSEQRARLATACGDDHLLLKEIESLLSTTSLRTTPSNRS